METIRALIKKNLYKSMKNHTPCLFTVKATPEILNEINEMGREFSDYYSYIKEVKNDGAIFLVVFKKELK